MFVNNANIHKLYVDNSVDSVDCLWTNVDGLFLLLIYAQDETNIPDFNK